VGWFQGIGFAVPSNQAKYVYKALKENGKVTRGWLGVSIRDVAGDLLNAKSFGFDGTVGVLVEETFANTPAYGKLEAGDIVTELNGKPTQNVFQLRNAIAATPPDTDVTLKV
jgi:serine protease Do